MTKVFLSSTCYDLIDLRVELEQELKDMGLDPILSDGRESEFELTHGENSIQQCIINVKKSDIFILILSQRYGPSIEIIENYKGLSATHIEFKVAVAEKKPIFFFIRDRLLADFNIWKKNKTADLSYSWVKSDRKILEFIEERSTLEADKDNWFSDFSNSIDLKKQIRKHLKKYSLQTLFEKLKNSGKLPFLIPTINNFDKTNKLVFSFYVSNIGTSLSLNVYGKYELISKNLNNIILEGCSLNSINLLVNKEVGNSDSNKINFCNNFEKQPEDGCYKIRLKICYKILEGYFIFDEWESALDFEKQDKGNGNINFKIHKKITDINVNKDIISSQELLSFNIGNYEEDIQRENFPNLLESDKKEFELKTNTVFQEKLKIKKVHNDFNNIWEFSLKGRCYYLKKYIDKLSIYNGETGWWHILD